MQIHRSIALFFIAALISVICIPTPGNCDTDLQELSQQVITGTIFSLDWVGSVVTLDRIVDLQHDQVRFKVPGSAKIYKGSDAIMFSDLNMWDRVRIVYYNDAPAGGLKVVSITVLQ